MMTFKVIASGLYTLHPAQWKEIHGIVEFLDRDGFKRPENSSLHVIDCLVPVTPDLGLDPVKQEVISRG